MLKLQSEDLLEVLLNDDHESYNVEVEAEYEGENHPEPHVRVAAKDSVNEQVERAGEDKWNEEETSHYKEEDSDLGKDGSLLMLAPEHIV